MHRIQGKWYDYQRGMVKKSLSTEELAEFLADKCNEVVDTVLSDSSCNIDDADQDDYWYRKTDFVEWLKEIHKDS
jgi:hypothetical protein